MEKGMTLEEFKTEVLNRIKNRNEQLKSLFSAGEYETMPKKFTHNARLVTHEGKVIPGMDSEDYWRKVGEDLRGTDLDFEIEHLREQELKVSPERRKDEIDFVAFEITRFSFKAGETTYRGYIDPPYRHRVRCDID